MMWVHDIKEMVGKKSALLGYPFFPGNFPGNALVRGKFPFPGKLKSPGNCKL